jgi:predicted phosphodiesterase
MMDLYAVLSDIHGNFSALKKVVQDARDVAARENGGKLTFICLGDIVDYGPQPNECMEWACREPAIILQGNHDRVATTSPQDAPVDIAQDYWPIVLWTRQVLHDTFKDCIRSWPSKIESPAGLSSFTLFHSSLVKEDTVIDNVFTAVPEFDALKTEYGLFGHTHFQGCFIDDVVEGMTKLVLAGSDNTAGRIGSWLPLPASRGRALFNPGSVGQPRTHDVLTGAGVPHDYHAAYMLLRLNTDGSGAVQFRRVWYDVSETVKLLRKLRWPTDMGNPNMPDRLSDNPMLQAMIRTIDEMDLLLPELVKKLIRTIDPEQIEQVLSGGAVPPAL